MPLSTIMMIGMGVVAVIFVLLIIKLTRREKTVAGVNPAINRNLPASANRGPRSAPAHLIERAQRGDVATQLELGHMYANGQGVRMNLPEAVEWFNLAAARNSADAYNALGMLYAHGGEGVLQNYRKSAACYEKAANMGDVRGQMNYAGIVEHGHGALKSSVTAYMWYTLAYQKADEDERLVITDKLHNLVRGMNDEQIAEARKRADEWWAEHYG